MIVNYFSDLYDDLHKQKVPFFKYQRGGDVGLYLSFYRTKISINPGNILIYVILCNILATSDFAETADLFTRSCSSSHPSVQATVAAFGSRRRMSPDPIKIGRRRVP